MKYNKKEHLKLIKIINTIKYIDLFNKHYKYDWVFIIQECIWEVDIIVNVREIIFTKEFKETFENYYYWEQNWTLYLFDWVLDHLDNPVDYLYRILFK